MIVGCCLVLLLIGIYKAVTYSTAETGTGVPESGATSRIKVISDYLTTKNVGKNAAGTWGDWGAMWNRIYSAGLSAVDYTKQQYQDFDEYSGYSGDTSTIPPAVPSATPPEPAGYYHGEDAQWSNSAGTATTGVWKDTRTGLYWSNELSGTYTNSFPNDNHSSCDFFNRTLYPKRGDYWSGSGAIDTDCGNAINACANLSTVTGGTTISNTSWYLPSQKELLMAYIDGIWNQTNATWVHPVPDNWYYWSSSEVSNVPTYAWSVALTGGTPPSFTKSTPYAVRCVSRDL